MRLKDCHIYALYRSEFEFLEMGCCPTFVVYIVFRMVKATNVCGHMSRGLWMLRQLLTGLIALIVWAMAGFTVAAAPVGQVKDVRIGAHSDYTRFVVEMDKVTAYQVFTLANPYRVVIDMPELDWKGHDGKGTGLVKGYRYGLFRPGVSRIVIDAQKAVSIQKHFFLPPKGDSGARLVLDLKPVTADAFAGSNRKVSSKTWSTYVAKLDDVDPAAEVATPAPSVQQKPLVVIDPGHGGPDPGAIGGRGTYEKKVTLAVAKAVKKKLEASGRYRVLLTRDKDFYIPLRKRYQIAEDSKASLFISLHADKIERKSVRGASIYTLSEKASDVEAAKLAANENKSDLIVGVDLKGYDKVVARTLLDFEQRATMEQSWHFAEMAVKDLGKEIALLRNTHRFAGFAVLKSPTVPSVLIEMGYLSNRKDEKLLNSPAQHKRIGTALLRAVDAFFDRQQRLSRS